ncbi:MAG: T9SS type A sorting domain-containing protein [Ignavibacteriales bacterium]|nr:T9SS type A sorting domain-containing protein [Ignavibacteriales bacterium]
MTWTKTDSISLPGGIGKLFADGNALYAAGKGTYKSTDLGSHWQYLGCKDNSLNLIAAKGSRVLAGHVQRSWDADSTSSLYLSTDGGTNWKTIWHSDTIVLKSAALGDNKIFILTSKGKIFSCIVDGISWMDNTGSCTGETPIEVLTSGSLTSALFNNAAFASSDNGITWSAVKEGYAGTGINVLAVSGSNIYAHGSGKFYRSTDNGTNWLIIPSEYQYMFTGVNAIVANGSVAFAGTFDGLYRSNDNGNRWDYTGAYGNWGYSHREDFGSILVRGAEVFAGSWGGQIFHSTKNGGYGTWTCSLLDSTKVPPYTGPPGPEIHSIVIKGSNIFVAAGGSWGVMCSTDGGLKWKSVNAGLTNILMNHEVYQLVAIDSCLFAATGGGVFFSTNNGVNWTAANNGLPNQPWDTHPDVRTLLAVGTKLYVPYGPKIFLSTNYGTSWSAVDSSLTSSINALSSDGSSYFAGTARGIWRRPLSEMVPTSVKQSPSPLPENYSLSQNYPNPFNPNTWIEYSIPQQSHVTIKIFDLLGREVAVLVNEKKDAGRYSVQWNASAMPSGIYFYRLEANGRIEIKKAIVMK